MSISKLGWKPKTDRVGLDVMTGFIICSWPHICELCVYSVTPTIPEFLSTLSFCSGIELEKHFF